MPNLQWTKVYKDFLFFVSVWEKMEIEKPVRAVDKVQKKSENLSFLYNASTLKKHQKKFCT